MVFTRSLALSLFCVAAVSQTPARPGPALKGFDPVELSAGKEVKGSLEHTGTYGKFRYEFASAENRKTFEKNPEQYAIQFGGSCMKMGPLSGGGSPDRYHVHDGRIYIFASESCRDGFKANPTRFIDQPDEAPKGPPDAGQRAERLLRTAVDAVGGEAALKGLTTVQTRYQLTHRSGNSETKYSREVATSFPATHVERDIYGTSRYTWLLLPDSGYLSWDKGPPVDPSVWKYMVREFYRDPLRLLKAWQGGRARAVHQGAGTVGDVAVERVALSIEGATTTLSIDPASGRVLRAAYRGRAAAGIGQVEKEFADFRPVGGVTVPFAVTTRVDGKPLTNPAVAIESIRVNEPIDAELLRKPA